MKKYKIMYWITTGIIALMMCYSGYAYFYVAEARQGFQHLGFPDYFRIELGVAKFIGALVLVLPVIPRIKEWAYAGFGIVFISAVVAHTASGDPLVNNIGPAVFLVLLIISYISYHKVQDVMTTVK
jgi:hypothetical protein